MITWAQVEQDFEWDGSLLDIYVRSATIKDWKAVYNHLRRNPTLGFFLDGDAATLPEDVTEVFAMRPLKSPMLSVRFGSVTVVTHFISEDEIECDIDPRDVRSQVDLDAVFAFLKQIGDCVAKPVLLTPENYRESEILRYDPCFHEFQYAAQRNG